MMGVGRGEDTRHVLNGACRNSAAQELRREFFSVEFPENDLQDSVECFPILDPQRIGGETRIGAQFGATEQFAGRDELAVVASAKKHRAGLRGELFIRGYAGVLIAAADRCRARLQIAGRMRMQIGERAVVQAHIELLTEPGTLALQGRHQDSRQRVHARADIDDGHAHAQGAGIRAAVHAHVSGDGLDDGVVARQSAERPVFAEAGNLAVDQTRKLAGEDVLVAQPPALERSGLEVVDEDIGAFEQAKKQVTSFLFGEIDRRVTFVAIDAAVIGAAIRSERSPCPGLIADGRFDFDDLRSVVTKNLGAKRAREHARKVNHLKALECATGLLFHYAVQMFHIMKLDARMSEPGQGPACRRNLLYEDAGFERGDVMAGRRLTTSEATKKGSDPANPSGALLRGLDVLQAFGPEKDALGNAEIAAATGLPKPTVSRLTRALVDAGYLNYDAERGKYRLRPRVLTLGFSLLNNMKILPIAHEHLQRLALASGCTVSLAWPDAPNMIYLDRCAGDQMPYFFSVGSAVDMARTATGQAYIAALDPASRRSLISGLKSHSPTDWTNVAKAIDQAVHSVAERGFCLVDNAWRRNIRGIAAPLISADGRTIMTVNCVTTTFAMSSEELVEKWAPGLLKVTQGLATHL